MYDVLEDIQQELESGELTLDSTIQVYRLNGKIVGWFYEHHRQTDGVEESNKSLQFYNNLKDSLESITVEDCLNELR